MRFTEEQANKGRAARATYNEYLEARRAAEAAARAQVAEAVAGPYNAWVVSVKEARGSGLAVDDIMAAMGTKSRATVYKALKEDVVIDETGEHEPW
jgi:hypothetical protein